MNCQFTPEKLAEEAKKAVKLGDPIAKLGGWLRVVAFGLVFAGASFATLAWKTADAGTKAEAATEKLQSYIEKRADKDEQQAVINTKLIDFLSRTNRRMDADDDEKKRLWTEIELLKRSERRR